MHRPKLEYPLGNQIALVQLGQLGLPTYDVNYNLLSTSCSCSFLKTFFSSKREVLIVSYEPPKFLGREELEREGMEERTGEIGLPKAQVSSNLLISKIL